MKGLGVFFKFSGVACIPIYVLFTFISHLSDPKVGPLTNWLSDLGNPLTNPSGALIYNVGCILVAVLLCAFFVGMSQWYRRHGLAKKYRICFVGAQAFGIAASLFLVLASLFPLGNHTPLHSLFSQLNMIGLDCFLSFTALAFLLNLNNKRWIGAFGYSTAVFNIVTTNAFTSLCVAEWIYFLLFMVYMVIITQQYDRIVELDTLGGLRPKNGSIEAVR